MILSVVLVFSASSEEWIIVLLVSSLTSRHYVLLAPRGGHLSSHKAYFLFTTVLFRHSALAPRLSKVQGPFFFFGRSINNSPSGFGVHFWQEPLATSETADSLRDGGLVLPAVGSTPEAPSRLSIPLVDRRSFFSSSASFRSLYLRSKVRTLSRAVLRNSSILRESIGSCG